MREFLESLGIRDINMGAGTGSPGGWLTTTGKPLESYSPVDGRLISTVIQATAEEYEIIASKAADAFKSWRMMPAPKRGQIVREMGQALRKNKKELATIISVEMGKTIAESEGEVQEMIDIADFAVGLSRQLYGLTMPSERPCHRLQEQWLPLGVVGVVTAFNFPAAVWSWNAFIAAVCGDTIIWKPSSKSPLSAIAVQNIIAPVIEAHNIPGVFNLVIGKGSDVGELLINDRRIPLISATGSTKMGIHIGETVARRLGRSLLELGGNNAVIIDKNADHAMALRAVLFGAVGTTGQRCTSTRRVFVHSSMKEEFIQSLITAYEKIRIGTPLYFGTLVGPMVDKAAVEEMMTAIDQLKEEGGTVRYGGQEMVLPGFENGCYVMPCIAEAENHYHIVQTETFAPILYIMGYDDIDEAIAMQNDVPQGLSSSIFTLDMRHMEQFLSPRGSDCGIANINVGTSGAEIGGAFGGEKETGGGRESGSDAWKIYMRRQTNTINWGRHLPLAQGLELEI